MRTKSFLLLFLLFVTPLVAEEAAPKEDKVEETTVRKVRFKKNKISVSKRDDLVLSGNVQIKWNEIEIDTNADPRDPDDPNGPFIPPLSPNQVWTAEANLWINHRTDCTWAEMNFRFKQFAGQKTGTTGKWTLERAFIGYQFWDCPDKSRLQVELGRMKISDRFQSEVEYCSLFNGILFGYGVPLRGFADLYLQLGAMVIDFRSDFYSWIVGADFDSILGTGWYFKYSFIDWARRSPIRLPFPPPVDPRVIFPYRNSQFLVGYKFPLEWTCKIPVHVNGGVVWNHAARREPELLNHLGNVAWWVQLQLGKIVKKCDWALKIGYQYVGLFSILESDVCGIGRGNLSNSSIFTQGGLFRTPGLIRGNTNYRGVAASFVFAATDNLSVQVSYNTSREITELFGGVLHYSKSEIKFSYIF